VLNRWQSIHHLLRLGLLSTEELLDRPLLATESVSRNQLIRIERQAGSVSIKQPKDAGRPDAATMWTEAAFFWSIAHDPAFGSLAGWVPRFFHYDEPQKILTIEYVAPAVTLAEKLLGVGIPPPLAAEVGRAFATLHGRVSLAAAGQPADRLFAALLPWVLTIGLPDTRYAPPTAAAAAVLGDLMRRPDAAAGLARLRSEWRPVRIIHGDAKATNILILPDDSIRLIDWEIAGKGDPLWDLGGLVHSLLLPNPGGIPEPLDQAQARARPLAEALWAGYVAGLPMLPPGPDPRVAVLRMAGARILQTCLESAHYGTSPPGAAALLDLASELMARPEAALERWSWAA
jgi:Phosphotransferase enzyme family